METRVFQGSCLLGVQRGMPGAALHHGGLSGLGTGREVPLPCFVPLLGAFPHWLKYVKK